MAVVSHESGEARNSSILILEVGQPFGYFWVSMIEENTFARIHSGYGIQVFLT